MLAVVLPLICSEDMEDTELFRGEVSASQLQLSNRNNEVDAHIHPSVLLGFDLVQSNDSSAQSYILYMYGTSLSPKKCPEVSY